MPVLYLQDGEDKYTESEEEDELCLKMPAVAKAPEKPKKPEKPLRQSTLTQTMKNFYKVLPLFLWWLLL